MYSAITKKASLSAFQRWELGALSDEHGSDESHIPTTQQLDTLQAQAREQGFNQGYAEGVVQGRNAIESENRLAVDQLRSLVETCSVASKRLGETVGPVLADLAAQIAQRIVCHELTVRPEIINDLVQELMSEICGSPLRLFLHPADAALIRASSTDSAIRIDSVIVETIQIERGGCRIETPLMSIDASLETTWQRVMNAFQSKVTWTGRTPT
jgi:flagellar assembly protein FliH